MPLKVRDDNDDVPYAPFTATSQSRLQQCKNKTFKLV